MNDDEYLEQTFDRPIMEMLSTAAPFIIGGIVLAVLGLLLAQKWRHRDYIATPIRWAAVLLGTISVIVGLIVGWVSYTF